ncbi:hypothetical protein [Halococcus hamelinensis]|uniref:Uncharacterized protein n=1 Tax=Halococcus hamelinensis 100A6 TaxID=1132509 RepID=M0M9M0_9EURY|nr:hypothetical protein [Halococcus hamelinensis]EMA42013.1 hypothetical protein C447_00445 [Halococcus hamelinensis 100A6]
MTTNRAVSSDRVLTKANFVRVYKSLTVVAVIMAAFSILVAGFPSALVNGVVGVWFLATLFVFAHLGIRNSTHGV